ncbi:tRNA adenosine(34) deaminase TadA [Chitinilyticum litopenaei]|uniref:tRNA adenosine(34) deaminase TadA n=1 Tax=Chitinilyticum litopenaei TaxID=1121276 RepID=UPI00040D88A6|nr:tRNA adenosine(34) deaminase TadA [Chitinilyticum litopenaei]
MNTSQINADQAFMAMALAAAAEAAHAGEVPVGAVLVKDGEVLAVAHNQPIGLHDPSAHAEMLALRAAAAALGNYRLDGCTLYVTLEPCPMCAGAILHSRIGRVVYGARDAKTGAAGSVVNLFANRLLNHHTHVEGGCCAAAAAEQLSGFFAGRRKG